MWFNSWTFLAFFPVTWSIFKLIPRWEAKKIFLLVASYVFYSCWNPPFLLLLLFTSWLDYHIGNRLGQETEPRRRKVLLVASLTINLGVLAFFKYAKLIV